MTNRFRATFTQRGEFIQGSVTSEGDGAFVLECLSEIVTSLSKKTGIGPDEIVRDLYTLITTGAPSDQS